MSVMSLLLQFEAPFV